jgi:hypothetical protein
MDVSNYIYYLAITLKRKRIKVAKGRRSLLQKSERQKPTKTKKNIRKCVNHHYIESVFLVHHYYDKNQTFDVLILPMASKKITKLKIKNINSLWRIT